MVGKKSTKFGESPLVRAASSIDKRLNTLTQNLFSGASFAITLVYIILVILIKPHYPDIRDSSSSNHNWLVQRENLDFYAYVGMNTCIAIAFGGFFLQTRKMLRENTNRKLGFTETG